MDAKSDGSLQLPVLLAPLATRREKYKALQKIERSKLNDQHTRCTGATRTTFAVKRNNRRLDKELDDVTVVGAAPQSNHLLSSQELERVKVASRAFSRIIKDSSTYKEELTLIKRCYDNRLDELLRSMNNVGLRWPVNTGSDDTPPELGSLISEVERLQKQTLLFIEDNSRLQDQWACLSTSNKTTTSSTSSTRPSSSIKQDKLDYAQQVDITQSQIFQIHKELARNIQSREGLVPLSVCQRLEQCIRSSELEIQKLEKSNGILQQKIKLMEETLRQYLEAVGTQPGDVLILWKSMEKRALEQIRKQQEEECVTERPADSTRHDKKDTSPQT